MKKLFLTASCLVLLIPGLSSEGRKTRIFLSDQPMTPNDYLIKRKRKLVFNLNRDVYMLGALGHSLKEDRAIIRLWRKRGITHTKINEFSYSLIAKSLNVIAHFRRGLFDLPGIYTVQIRTVGDRRLAQRSFEVIAY